MKCTMDCFNCRLPPSKCHGDNSKKTANPYRFVNRSHDGKGRTIKQAYRAPRKKGYKYD